MHFSFGQKLACDPHASNVIPRCPFLKGVLTARMPEHRRFPSSIHESPVWRHNSGCQAKGRDQCLQPTRILEEDSYKQRVTDAFNSRSPMYDVCDAYHPPLGEMLLEKAQILSGESVLDLATGTGLVALPAALQADPAQVVGIDISPGMLTVARAKAEQQGLQNLQLVEADVDSVSFPDSSFNVVTCSSAIIYFKDIQEVARKLLMWLQPGGRLVFNSPQEPCVRATVPFYELLQERHRLPLADAASALANPEIVESVLRTAGFSHVKIETTDEEMISLGVTPRGYGERMWRTMTAGSGRLFHPLENVLSPEAVESMRDEYIDRVAAMAKEWVVHPGGPGSESGVYNRYLMMWVTAWK